eukprot:Polyplicarium_translucidae@DN2565_c0_g1_i1.p1
MRYFSRIVLLVLTFYVLLLPAAAESNKKVSVIEVSFDSPVEDIQWLGHDHHVVLVRTKGGRLYRSMDSGRIWTEITQHLYEAGGRNTEIFVQSLMVNPTDKRVVLVVGAGKQHFASKDSGRTFHQIDHSGNIHNWMYHPSQPHVALLSRWTDHCNSHDQKALCNHELYVTKDAGRTFEHVANYVVQFGWGDPKHGDKHHNRIFLTHHRGKHGEQQRHGKWLPTVDFAYTDDFGHSVKTVLPRGNKFLISNGYIFVAVSKQHVDQTVELHVSTDGGDSFGVARLPVQLRESSYTILDTSEDAVVIHVNHGEHGKSTSGNIYVSDPRGLSYSLSLAHNVRTITGECEFDRVLSVDGVYISNYKETVYDTGLIANMSADQFDEMQKQEEEEIESMETEVDRRRKGGHGRSQDVVRTAITFNKGGSWGFLEAPRTDSLGNTIHCGDNCYLHLHGITNFDRFAPFYSVENAVGIVMGTGNVGSHLNFASEEANTYLSRDGGLTWVEAHKGPYIYEFGDHGGLIAMADDSHATDKVVFSWNEGQTWYDFELGKDMVQVDNIVIEPNSSSIEFLLYGMRNDAGILYHLDFETLGQPLCRGMWAPDSLSSDYESWMPNDGRVGRDKCLLGRQVTYTRRKGASECFNGRDFKARITKKNCECTVEDFECDFGFTRRVGSTDCRPDDPSLTAPHCTSSSYFHADAHRRVPGNSCEGGWKPSKILVPCPAHAPFSRGAKTVLFCILAMGCALAIITFLSRNPRYRAMLRNYGFETFANVKYSMVNPKHHGDTAFDGEIVGRYAPDLGFVDSDPEDDPPPPPDLLSMDSRPTRRPVVERL